MRLKEEWNELSRGAGGEGGRRNSRQREQRKQWGQDPGGEERMGLRPPGEDVGQKDRDETEVGRSQSPQSQPRSCAHPSPGPPCFQEGREPDTVEGASWLWGGEGVETSSIQ